jgi:hypothetical protein
LVSRGPPESFGGPPLPQPTIMLSEFMVEVWRKILSDVLVQLANKNQE